MSLCQHCMADAGCDMWDCHWADETGTEDRMPCLCLCHQPDAPEYSRLKDQKEEILQRQRERLERPLLAEIDSLRLELRSYAKRCDRFSAGLERIMEICRDERLPSSQIYEIAEEALIEPEREVNQ